MRAAPQQIGPFRYATIGNRARVQVPSAGPYADWQLARSEVAQLRDWCDRFLDGDGCCAVPAPTGLRLVRGLSADGDRPMFEEAGDARD
ncbi:hypothetical protein [Methylobacterium nodulans]|uniref:Uncharacterized protein n=1 Tax=Methylobacterium nodulans (strain LMG 21967 / CNCM I-2342 / ORS 2060) TaxID=460265 RepID=B8INW7_METNO|nr:hypothetical protein [Methylobacterium nodulans]ACL58483.1 hypothetical protein Mnod_3574 [Methylobacterium nodulans ORS 2060]